MRSNRTLRNHGNRAFNIITEPSYRLSVVDHFQMKIKKEKKNVHFTRRDYSFLQTKKKKLIRILLSD